MATDPDATARPDTPIENTAAVEPDDEAADDDAVDDDAVDDDAVDDDAPPVIDDPSHRVRPEQTLDDTDVGWGERRDQTGHDRWLHEQRPPHWE